MEADGTREMTMTYYLPFNELLNNKKQIDTEGNVSIVIDLLKKPGSTHQSQETWVSTNFYKRSEKLG